ncbi:bifunctional 3-deoxy-7-phosphoheptulonate synthase/chorismate mutase type II [Lewinella cohaerens]|uniref:bifunctional 3-deoxy-7-phosphoheptulonate synthase/chorismate mutase type II n=1 Tax=Lewinella cohaerens TaxID=70995 RepID=UPI00037B570D|nr:bifunctional 3-deoxy-7-phosphoheptulonate synthase/chorismate mutase type II [Lewinella cohaerens]
MNMQFEPIAPKSKRPFIIAGPCSAETEGQVMATAKALAEQNIDLFRAGIWKPRTRPGSFEGVGKEGLSWLKRVKEETGLKVTTEVAKADHVYEALKYGIDVLWLGARTTVNPFSVQEIADAVSGMDIPVLIKNPINPDLPLWMGAIERIYKAGITKIGVIHRGFSFHGETKFRNVPRWQLAIELKRNFPDLMMICDNSHICGRRDLLQEVAQEAMDLNYDGIMTEVHPRPDEAWSDAAQQITPDTFRDLVSSLVLRQENSDDVEYLAHIDDLRQKIDEIDDDLLKLLGSRMKVSEKIGEYKKRNNIAILQTSRWNEILDQVMVKANAEGLSEGFVNTFLRAIHQESIDHQEKVMNSQEA